MKQKISEIETKFSERKTNVQIYKKNKFTEIQKLMLKIRFLKKETNFLK